MRLRLYSVLINTMLWIYWIWRRSRLYHEDDMHYQNVFQGANQMEHPTLSPKIPFGSTYSRVSLWRYETTDDYEVTQLLFMRSVLLTSSSIYSLPHMYHWQSSVCYLWNGWVRKCIFFYFLVIGFYMLLTL